MGLVAVLGVVTIVSSRNERQAALNPIKSEKPRPPAPQKKFPGDHWHAAYGIYVCDRFLPPINSDRDPLGIHTHNDGVIHIHPFTRAAAGRKATLGAFARTVGLGLSEDRIKVPGGETYAAGEKCGDEQGRVRVFVNGTERRGDPADVRLRDRDLVVVAFAPEGKDVPDEPPSAPELDRLTDVPGSPGATTVPSGSGPTETTPPAPETTTPTTGTPPTSAR